MASSIHPHYMDVIYNCRQVANIDIFGEKLTKLYIDWDYEKERILIRTINWYYIECSNLTVGQVIKILGYDNHIIHVIWSQTDIITNVLDRYVKNSSLSMIHIYNNN